MNSPIAPCRAAGNTVDTDKCFDAALKDADHKMNQLYAQVLSVLQPDDQQKLRVAQRLWVQYRDATCNAERDLYGSGTGSYPAYLACLEEETRLRTGDLQTTYGWVIEKSSN
jgi:uncharacterized protein YecT (DUF1311 family)